jgi:hypothetical protein
MTHGGDIDTALGQANLRLVGLSDALRRNDADALAGAAAELQRVLPALQRAGRLPASSRRQLAELAAQTAAQREALARAGSALKRAIDTLLPGSVSIAGYAADGLPPRQTRVGWTRA